MKEKKKPVNIIILLCQFHLQDQQRPLNDICDSVSLRGP